MDEDSTMRSWCCRCHSMFDAPKSTSEALRSLSDLSAMGERCCLWCGLWRGNGRNNGEDGEWYLRCNPLSSQVGGETHCRWWRQQHPWWCSVCQGLQLTSRNLNSKGGEREDAGDKENEWLSCSLSSSSSSLPPSRLYSTRFFSRVFKGFMEASLNLNKEEKKRNPSLVSFPFIGF